MFLNCSDSTIIRKYFSGTVNFNHREGCQKCEVVGRYFKRLRRMSFIHSNCALRNDQSFRQRIHPNHHKTFSIIEKLPIDMVRDFVVADPLHLLELGVLKTYAQFIIGSNNFNFH